MPRKAAVKKPPLVIKPEPPYRVLITGSRHWTDKETIREALFTEWKEAGKPEEMIVITGACMTGADAYAERVGKAFGWKVETHPADWERYGRAAGPVRNRSMASLGADVCLAFPFTDSKGTANCIKAAQEVGIPVKIFSPYKD
jgi:hypothetical protein